MSYPIIVHDQPAAETAAPPVTPKRETITVELRKRGLTFEPAAIREALKRQGKGGK
jgi:hypothetical protein